MRAKKHREASPDAGNLPKTGPPDPGAGQGVSARVWAALTLGAIVAIGLLGFILQNTTKTRISFLVWDFTMPVGVGLLFAAISGVLVMALVGGVRIWQLRHALARAQHTGTDRAAPGAAAPPPAK